MYKAKQRFTFFIVRGTLRGTLISLWGWKILFIDKVGKYTVILYPAQIIIYNLFWL